MNMKFMQNAAKSEKHKLKEQSKMLIQQIEQDEYEPEDTGLFHATNKFAPVVKKTKRETVDADTVLEVAKEMF